MSATVTSIGYCKFDGVTVANPSAITFSKNKIWSTNTGRKANAEMTGTIKAVKKKIEITWNTLTESEVKVISDIVDSTTEWHTIDYYDITKKKAETFTAYFGDSAYAYYGYDARKRKRVNGLKVDGIEK